MILARWQASILDEVGNVVPGASIEVRREDTGALPQLYSDRNGTVTKGNPFAADADGFAFFHVVGGSYKITATFGLEVAIWRYVGIGLNAEADTIASRTQRTVTAAGAVTIAADDTDDIIIKKTAGEPTTVNLCSAALRRKTIRIIDGKGDAETNNITIVPATGQTIHAIADYQKIIDGNGGSAQLTPLEDGTGWY